MRATLFVCILLAMLAATLAGQSFTNVQVNPPSGSPFITNLQTEPTVAQNPLNPLNLIVSAADFSATPPCPNAVTVLCRFANVSSAGYYASFDGGVTWPCHDLVPAGPLGWPEFNHSVVFDSRGNAFYVSRSTDNGSISDIMVAKSTDGGCNFNAISLASVAAPAGENNSPNCCNGQAAELEAIAADTHLASPYRDNLYAAWTQFTFAFNPAPEAAKVVFARSTDGGLSWTNAKALSISNNSNVAAFRGAPAIQVAPNGTVYVIWADLDKDGYKWLLAQSTDGGKTFSGQNILASRITDDATFLPEVGLAGRLLPSFSQDAAGNLYLAWSNYINGHGVVLLTSSSDLGQTWSPAVPAASLPGRSALWSAIAIDPANRLNLVFRTLDEVPGGTLPGPGTAYVNTYFAQSGNGGASFSPPVLINTAASDINTASSHFLAYEGLEAYFGLIADSRSGGVFAVWTDLRNASRCAAVDAFRSGTGPAPNVIAQCPISFGNSDIVLGHVTY